MSRQIIINTSMVAIYARDIFNAFNDYNADFRRITQRAKTRFEQMDWQGLKLDSVERIELYDQAVLQTLETLERKMRRQYYNKKLWSKIRDCFAAIIASQPDSEFYKTFFSSITRRIFNTVGVNPHVEFVALDIEPTAEITQPVPHFIFGYQDCMKTLCAKILRHYDFKAPYRDFGLSIQVIIDEVEYCCALFNTPLCQIEMVKPIFYQISRAYLVGRIIGHGWIKPFIIALKNTPNGILVDAAFSSDKKINLIFGFTRNYFHVDLEIVGPAVAFLKSIMPQKHIEELYTLLGRAKQGKTERYRCFSRHLESSQDLFMHAAGDKGMVMIVFTLDSYDVVFKIIRDRFAYPKTTIREEVIDKYQLVFKHDRAGRLVDAQEFRSLKFKKDRFAPELLEELLTESAETCEIENEYLIIKHLYIEQRLTPLNLYLRQERFELARQAVIDYGQCMRDLALCNIFTGDLLLKNFGVSRDGRVIFYDYDELCLVSECNFRELPKARNQEDEIRSETWFYVAENDLFPEEFISFLSFGENLKQEFLRVHGDLLTAAFWRNLKQIHMRGDIPDIIPYRKFHSLDHPVPQAL